MYKTEQNGDILSLYFTLVTDQYDYIGVPRSTKFFRSAAGRRRFSYVSYKTDGSPSAEQVEASKHDNTGISTGNDIVYSNEEIGLTIHLLKLEE